MQLSGQVIICPHPLLTHSVQRVDLYLNLPSLLVLSLSDPSQPRRFILLQRRLPLDLQLSELQLMYARLCLIELYSLMPRPILNILSESLLP